MNVYNFINIVGRCVADPELRTTPNGIAVATVRVAVDRPFRKDKEREVDFFTVEAWRAQAPYLQRNWHRGEPISVIGELRSENYTDKDGVKRSAVKIIADQIGFTIGKKQGGQNVTAVGQQPLPGDSDAPPDYSRYDAIPPDENEMNY